MSFSATNTIVAPVGVKYWIIPHDPTIQPIPYIGNGGPGGGGGGGGADPVFKCWCGSQAGGGGCTVKTAGSKTYCDPDGTVNSCLGCCSGYLDGVGGIALGNGSFEVVIANSLDWNGTILN